MSIYNIDNIKTAINNPSLVKKEVKKILKIDNPVESDIYKDINKLIQNKSPVVVDGGAYNGKTIQRWRQIFAAPTIYAFEPNPELYRELNRRFSHEENIHVYDIALSDEEGKTEMHISSDPLMSSLLEPTEDYFSEDIHSGGIQVEETIEVDTGTIDNIVNDDIDVLKLDLQGNDFHALQGCKKRLEDISVVMCETMFNTNYKDQKTFTDIHGLLSSRGFTLYNIYDIKYWPNGQIRHCNSLFVNQSKYKDAYKL